MSASRRELLGLAGALLAGMAGCAGEQSNDGEQTDTGEQSGNERLEWSENPTEELAESDLDRIDDPDLSDAEISELTSGINALAADLLVELTDNRDDPNLFASPASISVALAMAYAGAGNGTAAEIKETLHYPDDPHPKFNAFDQSLEKLPESAEDDEQLSFEVANRMWGQAGFPFEEQFLDTLAEHYGAGVQQLDFKNEPEESRETINEWVADQTEEKVPELLPKGSLDKPGEENFVISVLTNAIYMLADWKYVFDEENTEQRTFTTVEGEQKDAELMSQEFTVPYGKLDGHQVIDLPYVGERLSMTVILPPEGEFESTRDELTGDRLEEFVNATYKRQGKLWLPHFEISTDFELSETLEALGMESSFSERQADFTDMYDRAEANLGSHQRAVIDEVYHEAFVAVDEEGTEAAAATAVVIGGQTVCYGCDNDPEPFEMVCDRPFLFAIRDRETGAVLFLGQVGDAAAIQS